MRSATHESDARRDGSQLAELLECERELAELLSAAHADARRRIDAARVAAKAMEADGEADLGVEADKLRTELRERTRGQVREIRAATRDQVGRFDRMTDEQVELLAGATFRRLIRLEDAS